MVRILKQSFEIIREENPLKRIEMAGRTCYKSEEKMTKDSAEQFVKMILGRGHESVLEHAAIALCVSEDMYEHILRLEDRAFLNMTYDGRPIISGNIHAWRDMFRNIRLYPDKALCAVLAVLRDNYMIFFGDLPPIYSTPPSKLFKPFYGEINKLYKLVNIVPPSTFDRLSKSERMKHEYMTVRVIVNRGVSHEWVRSRRQSSYSQESTRYVCYAKKKHGNQISVIDYDQYLVEPEESKEILNLLYAAAEICYQDLIKLGNKPQIARNVLPIGLKTEIVVTYPLFQWHYFFKLRTPKVVHPQMREIVLPLLEAAKKEKPGIFDDIIPEE